MAVAGPACSSAAKNVDRFTGTWQFASGTAGGTCLGQQISNDLTGQTFTLAAGSGSDLVSTFGSCTVTLSVDGTRASASPTGQMCTFMFPFMGQNVSVTAKINTWTNDSTDATHLTVAATATGSGGLTDGCPLMLGGIATKASGGDAGTGG